MLCGDSSTINVLVTNLHLLHGSSFLSPLYPLPTYSLYSILYTYSICEHVKCLMSVVISEGSRDYDYSR